MSHHINKHCFCLLCANTLVSYTTGVHVHYIYSVTEQVNDRLTAYLTNPCRPVSKSPRNTAVPDTIRSVAWRSGRLIRKGRISDQVCSQSAPVLASGCGYDQGYQLSAIRRRLSVVFSIIIQRTINSQIITCKKRGQCCDDERKNYGRSSL